MIEKRTLIDNLDMLLLCVDEILDDGYAPKSTWLYMLFCEDAEMGVYLLWLLHLWIFVFIRACTSSLCYQHLITRLVVVLFGRSVQRNIGNRCPSCCIQGITQGSRYGSAPRRAVRAAHLISRRVSCCACNSVN
jgi:hypothetical protein